MINCGRFGRLLVNVYLKPRFWETTPVSEFIVRSAGLINAYLRR